MNDEKRTDDVLGWLLLASGLSALAFVPSVIVFFVTYLRGIALHAELLTQTPIDPALLAAADANDATSFVSAVVATVSGTVLLVAGTVAVFRWHGRDPSYPTGG